MQLGPPLIFSALQLAIVVVAATSNASSSQMSVAQRLAELAVVPDVLDSVPANTSQLEVLYDQRGAVSAQLGNQLTPTQVRGEPRVRLAGLERWGPGELFTLMVVDPDAPSRAKPAMREVLHQLVANVPLKAGQLDVAGGDQLAEYIGSGAPQGSGLHRYVHLLFRQPGRLASGQQRIRRTQRQGRLQFSARAFVAQHRLGPLLAANCFQAQYDDSVPELHRQLSQG